MALMFEAWCTPDTSCSAVTRIPVHTWFYTSLGKWLEAAWCFAQFPYLQTCKQCEIVLKKQLSASKPFLCIQLCTFANEWVLFARCIKKIPYSADLSVEVISCFWIIHQQAKNELCKRDAGTRLPFTKLLQRAANVTFEISPKMATQPLL